MIGYSLSRSIKGISNNDEPYELLHRTLNSFSDRPYDMGKLLS